jgi:hypothetical protein
MWSFGGVGSGGQFGQGGIYSAPVAGGPLTVIADLNTVAPVGNGIFTNILATVSISGSTVGFHAATASVPDVIYVGSSNSSLIRIADTNTPIPGSAGNFNQFNRVFLSGSSVFFSSLQQGIYGSTITGGPLNKVVDTSTPVPNGTGTFNSFGYFASSGGMVAFNGGSNNGSNSGIYASTANGGSLVRLVDNNTPIPNGSGNFGGLGAITISGNTVAFTTSSYSSGVYTTPISGGSISVVADSNTPVPGGAGNFKGFTLAYVGEATIAFLGYDGSHTGLYIKPLGGGTIAKILAPGDVLDGRTVSDVSSGLQGFNGSIYAFHVLFTDNTQAVYTFTPVPEPSGLLPVSVAAAAGAFAVGRWLFRGF